MNLLNSKFGIFYSVISIWIKKKRSLLSFFVLLTISMSFLYSFYGKILIHPNSYLFSETGDGIKAYYVYIYHIDNDTSLTQTKSINYPYGESDIYNDGQIFFANMFKVLKHIIPSITKYSIGFINLLMILSFLFCFLLLYVIFRKLRLPYYLCILGSLGIGMLSPQIFRLTGHLSLSYCFFVPLIWYLFIRFNESNRKWLFTSFIIILLTISPFIHGYYILMGTLLIFFLWLVLILQQRKRIRENKILLLHFLLQVAIPFIVVKSYLFLFDHHIGRVVDPFGMFVYKANLSTVFVPNQSPFNSLYYYFYEFKYQEWEGWAYIGTPMLFIVLFSIFKIFRYLINRNIKLIFKPVLPVILQSSIWSGILILLYSFGYPYRFHMLFLLDWFPILKQFRGLGRFAWVFYYIFTVYGIYVFYLFIRLLKQRRLVTLSICFQFCFFIVLFTEGFIYHKSISPQITTFKNKFKYSELDTCLSSAIKSIDTKKYQAIFPLQYFHVGSDYLTRTASDSSMRTAFYIAYHTKLPLMSTACARTSGIETRKLIQLLSPSFISKEAEPDFKDKRPLLITYTRENLKEDEYDLLSKSIKIFGNDHIELYELSLDSLFQNTSDRELKNFETIKESLHPTNEFLTSSDSCFILFKNFDNLKSQHIMNGSGAFQGIMKNYNVLLNDTVLSLNPNQEYEVSFWYYNRGSKINFNMFVIGERPFKGGDQDWFSITNTQESSIIEGDWTQIKAKFKIKNKGDITNFFLKGDNDSEQKIFVDNFLLRPANQNIYKILKEKDNRVIKLFKNNFVIESSIK